MPEPVRQLAAIMFTDMVGYTSLMQENERKAKEIRDRHRKVLEPSIKNHRGKILQYYGDGTLCMFGSAIEAVDCAVEIQRKLQQEPKIPLRIGIHLGDIVYDDEGIYGDSVNIASRIESLSISGAVLISEKVYDEIKNKPHLPTKSLGIFELKNVKRPMEVFAVTTDGLIVPKPEEVKGKTKDAVKTTVLIPTRITPPGLTGNIVHRKRLINLLIDNANKSLILICSSAGFGKTTLVQDFLSAVRGRYAWYYVTPDITNLYSFLTYIIYSLKRLSQKFGENSLRIIDAIKKDASLSKDYKNSINDITATFLNEFCGCFKDDVILVLDDLHNINSKEYGEWLNYLFNVLFDNLPPNLHLIITTRERPGFNISKLKAKRRILQLETNELVFDKDEIVELLENVYSLDYTVDDIKILQSNISGWITGIHLVLQAYGEDFKDVKFGDRLKYEEIFNYFVNNIFENLSERTKEFLLNTALLENFNYRICDHLLNINYSEKIISGLMTKNIFIQPTNIRSTDEMNGRILEHYNYQELFKLFLLSKLNELKTGEEINVQLKKLYNYYLSGNEFIPAINYGLKAKDYSSVIPLVIENFSSLFDKGSYDVLWEWLAPIPQELLSANPYLLYFSGLLQLYFRSEPERALKYLNDAVKLANDSKNVPLVIDCCISKTDALLLAGKIEELKNDLNYALTLDISRKDRARLLYAISRVSYREGHSKYKEIIELLTEALEICNQENLQSLKTDLFRVLGNIYSEWGEPIKAIYYYEQALNIGTDVYKIFRAMNNIVEQYCLLGNYIRAKEYLDKTIEMYKSFPSLLFKRFLLRCIGTFRFECADFEESIKNYEEVNNLEIKNNIKHYAGYQYIIIGEAYYSLKNYDAALKNCEIALNYIEENNEYHKLLDTYLKAKLSIRIKAEPETEKILLEALDFHDRHNIQQQKAHIEFNLADYYLRSGITDSAVKYLKDCLKVSSEKQFVSFLEQEVLNSRSVFDFVLVRPEFSKYKQFIKTLFENVRERLEYEWLSDECRKRLTLQIKELDDVSMASFGRLEFRLRGKLIPEAQWIRKKSKLILAYLLVKPNRVLTKSEIIDRFFHDIPFENVDTVYHNTLSNMRTALKVKYDFQNNSEKKTKSKEKLTDWSPVLLLYKDKVLHWNTDFDYTADNAEFEKLYNSAMSAGVKPDRKMNICMQAIEIYKGEFLPGYYDTWCEEMRKNYSNMFIKLCSELITILKEKKLYSEVIKYADKLLKTDKLNDKAYINMLEAYSKLGEVNMAKDKFSSMLKTYDEELGEKPSKSTMDKIKEFLT